MARELKPKVITGVGDLWTDERYANDVRSDETQNLGQWGVHLTGGALVSGV